MAFHGSKRIALGYGGEFILVTGQGEILDNPPVPYQEVAGERRPIASHYILQGSGKNRTVGFMVSGYDRTRPLVIDPVLSFSIVLGSAGDRAASIAVDKQGNIYLTGETSSDPFPGVTSGSFQ